MQGAFSWLIAWFIIIAGGIGLSRFEGGRKLLYYILWLAVILMIVAYNQEIYQIFKKANIAGFNQSGFQPKPTG